MRLLIAFIFISGIGSAQPQLKGGLESFILSNLKYPEFSRANCVEGTVSIAFKLDRKGRVRTSFIQSGVGTDLDDEALRLIRKSTGKWKVPEGFDTTKLLIVPVNFKLAAPNCTFRNKVAIQQAIAAFQVQRGLTDAILNFYKRKVPGVNDQDEQRFIQLKQELGYDEPYMLEKIEDGKAKLKSGEHQGACEDFLFVKYMGFDLADALIDQHCLPVQ